MFGFFVFGSSGWIACQAAASLAEAIVCMAQATVRPGAWPSRWSRPVSFCFKGALVLDLVFFNGNDKKTNEYGSEKLKIAKMDVFISEIFWFGHRVTISDEKVIRGTYVFTQPWQLCSQKSIRLLWCCQLLHEKEQYVYLTWWLAGWGCCL